VGPETLAGAFKDALLEVDEKKKGGEETAEGLRSSFLGLILWKIFAKGDTLWIDSETEAGNAVTLELLVVAYTMWENAVNLASKYGVDTAAAAEALAQATHAAADQLARNRQDPDGKEIRDIRKYVFASYMYSVFNIAGKQGSDQTEYVDMGDWKADRKLSDQGAFLEALESGILCREFLDAMPPKGRSVAIARYILGYSWPETAGALGTPINTAQKALSAGVRKAFGVCMREIRRVGYRKAANIEAYLAKNKKTSSWR
jgi:DNA-directed RNA polymerase specialized sigma24 family protein